MAYSNTTGYPSVTDILSIWIDPTYWTEEGRDRGSAVHNAIAAYLKGLYVKPLKKEWQGYFDSCRLWIDEYVDEIIIVEERLVDRALGYCGQLDLAAKLHGEDMPVQIDWKTGAPERWHTLQSAAYRHLLIEDRQIQTGRGLTVIPKPNGSGCRAVDHKNYRDMAIFTACLSAWRFFNSD